MNIKVQIPASRYLTTYLTYKNYKSLDLAGKYLNLQHCRQQRGTHTHAHTSGPAFTCRRHVILSGNPVASVPPHSQTYTGRQRAERHTQTHTHMHIHTRTLAATLFTPMPKHSKHNNAVCFALLACSGK